MIDTQPVPSDQLLTGQNPDTLERITIIATDAVTGLSQAQIEAIVVQNYWLVKPKNSYRPTLLPQPSDDSSENVGWLQRIEIPVGSGKIVMENNPGGVPAEMHYVPSSQSKEAGEVEFLFVANEIDLGRKCTVVDFVHSTRLAIRAMHTLLKEHRESEALSHFNFPYTLDYSLANILKRVKSPQVRDGVRSLRINSLIETHQPARAVEQINKLTTRQGTLYTDDFIRELNQEVLDQDKT